MQSKVCEHVRDPRVGHAVLQESSLTPDGRDHLVGHG
jgi:hypothetical protein